MYRKLGYSLVVVLLAYLVTASYGNAQLYFGVGRFPGAQILHGSCDPGVDPLNDASVDSATPWKKSCIGQSITREGATGTTPFTVTVEFYPNQPCTVTAPSTDCVTSSPPVTTTVPGPPVFPKSYTVTAGVATFNKDLCAPSAPTCYNIGDPADTVPAPKKQIYDSAGVQISVTTTFDNGSRAGSSINIAAGSRSGAAEISNPGVYTEPTPQYIPGTSPATVVTAPKMSGGVPVNTTLKCNPPVTAGNPYCNSSNQIGMPADPACHDDETLPPGSPSAGSCSHILVPNPPPPAAMTGWVAIASPGVPYMANVVYTASTNTIAVGSHGIGSASCSIGATETYVTGQPVMDSSCEYILDQNLCAHEHHSPCDEVLIAGALLYNTDGSPANQTGYSLKSAASDPVSITTNGSLYHSVFTNIPQSVIQALPDYNLDLADGQTPVTYTSVQAHFQLVYESNMACVYAYGSNAAEQWRVTKIYPQNLNEVYDSYTSIPTSPSNYSSPDDPNMDDHCIPAPPPDSTSAPLAWGSLLSPVCTDYTTSSTQFRWPSPGNDPVSGLPIPGTSRAFTGLVVECVKDTMLNLFYPSLNVSGTVHMDSRTNKGATFFSSMQSRLKGAISAVLTLYIIFIGYRMMIGAKKPPDRSEWMWIVLRVSMVVYFALGNGMTVLLPYLMSITDHLSVIVVEAGLNQSIVDPTDPNAAAISPNAYLYCDFRQPANGGINPDLHPYPEGKSAMEVWDMIDCKISTYLGIGANADYTDAPQVLFVAVLALISVGMGIPIFILTIIFLAVTVMIIMRVVHIYIMAVMGLLMLVFMSPLIIPASLFEATKGLFLKWVEQVTALILQPIILFAFLSIMFVMIDTVMFGGNHKFESSDIPMHIINGSGPVTHSNKACGSDSGGSPCMDKTAPAYQYQILDVSKGHDWPSSSFSIIKMWEVDFPDGEMGLMIGLAKLMLICFISYVILDTAEAMSARLVSAMGKGAADLSTAPVVGPAAMLGGIAAAGGAAANTASSVVRGGISTAVGAAKLGGRGLSSGASGVASLFKGGSGGSSGGSGSSAASKSSASNAADAKAAETKSIGERAAAANKLMAGMANSSQLNEMKTANSKATNDMVSPSAMENLGKGGEQGMAKAASRAGAKASGGGATEGLGDFFAMAEKSEAPGPAGSGAANPAKPGGTPGTPPPLPPRPASSPAAATPRAPVKPTGNGNT